MQYNVTFLHKIFNKFLKYLKYNYHTRISYLLCIIFRIEQLMRQCCENVAKYGDASCPTDVKLRHITVILNPAAKKRLLIKIIFMLVQKLLLY